MRSPHALALVLLATLAAAAPAQADSAAGAPPEQGSLLANVYTMTAAEYDACCMTIYRAATYSLEEIMEEMLEEGGSAPLRPAVVLDLDQTVLDVTSFQTFVYENECSYTPALWSVYEQVGVEEVLLVPGAKEFIGRAEELGVSVVYLSNRNAANQEHTIAVLARLGLNVEGIEDRIALKPTAASSDKSPRRDAISARYNVLMIFGDNLRDFSEVFKPVRLGDDAAADDYLAAIGERADAVDDAACHWGVDWFMLPNCMYGEWQKHIPDNPVDIMTPTEMTKEDAERDR